MARAQKVITDFSTGEISPLSEGRVNTTQYQSACRRLENFIVSSRGGVKRRYGMQFISEAKSPTNTTRLIPFIFNREQSYVLEFGDKYIRFHRSDGTVGESTSVDGRSSSPDKFGDTLFKPSLSSPERAREWIEVFIPYEIATPYTADQVNDIHFAQANDTMILVHPDHPPKRLVRNASDDWVLDDPTWQSPFWSASAGYPRTVVFFQQRLWFGGITTKPQTLWASRAADFYNFTITSDPELIKPDDALELGIAAYTQEKIEWLSSERQLIIGTSGSEQRLTPDQYVSVDNVPNIARMTSYGGRHIQPAYIGDLTIFIQGSGRQVRSYQQNPRSAIEQYISRDLAWFAEHITDTGVNAQAFELTPDSILWMIREDGQMISMTHDPSLGEEDYSSMGWARHPTDGQVVSITSIPNLNRDETWAITKRNGTQLIEVMTPGHFTDSCLTTPPDSEDELSAVGGLNHLKGKTVKVVVDGAVQKDKVVSDTGAISLDRPGKVIEIGLPYTSTLETTPYNDSSDSNTMLGTRQRWGEIWIKLVDSALPLVNGVRPSARTPSTLMDTPESLRSGDFDILSLGWDADGTILIEQDIPKQTQVVALFGVYQSYAG